ncbi:hypothetical protein ATO11_00650 [Pseudaestuariivita atlantica]|uniref:Arginine transporter n=1 Tax=Pseudaestuariivita atlantica TaxID=1317121 RepID=A0A0L1JV47_9RHOB|nr:hypothetical protein ATO11_00650 [Pseudaestuariivita atlantica]
MVLILAVGMAGVGSVPQVAEAGLISRACLKADRKAASRSLCGCIQSVANKTLTRSDQKMAASFFKDPHKAQVIRQSDRVNHEKFWQKYKAFGKTAEAMCRGA